MQDHPWDETVLFQGFQTFSSPTRALPPLRKHTALGTVNFSFRIPLSRTVPESPVNREQFRATTWTFKEVFCLEMQQTRRTRTHAPRAEIWQDAAGCRTVVLDRTPAYLSTSK